MSATAISRAIERTYPEQSGGPTYAVFDALDDSDYTEDILSLGWGAQWSRLWRSTVTASRFEHDERYHSPGIFPYFEVPPNAADTDFTRDQVQWLNTLHIAPGYETNVGADFRHEDGKSDGYVEFFGEQNPTDYALDRDTRGVFADISATPLPALLLHGSLRYDDPDGFDSETSAQAGVKYSVGDGVTLAANWGEAYKLPSFLALGHPLVGNPDLQPEQGESWDLGLSWEASDRCTLAATWFDNDFRDLVDFDGETLPQSSIATVCKPAVSNCRPTGSRLPHSACAPRPRIPILMSKMKTRCSPVVHSGRPAWSPCGRLARTGIPR